jgi:hypothetical protein
MSGINHYTRNKTLIAGRLVFAGGYPLFRWLPRFLRWGPNISIFWLGTELVFLGQQIDRAKTKAPKGL